MPASRMKLLHLTVVGKDLQPAEVEFGDHLTVIHGASDTGKSHILDLIRYVLGLTKAIDLPEEGKGYQYVHLGVRLHGDAVITFVRDLAGGRIGVFDGSIRELTTTSAPTYLPAQHISKDPNSASRRLLDHIDLDGSLVRTDQFNNTRPLEWRDVDRLTFVDEESIISRGSPIESGQYSKRPVEAAIFRLFLEGTDDSGLVSIPKPAEMRKLSASKVEVLNEVIARLEQELSSSQPLAELHDQLARLNSGLASASDARDSVRSARDELVIQRSDNTSALALLSERRDEVSSLIARFTLLREQYSSDISRLEMLLAATELLSFGSEQNCPFCGADTAHQHWGGLDLQTVDTPTVTLGITSERSKTVSLRDDLDRTITDLTIERQEIVFEAARLLDSNNDISAEVRRIDNDLNQPPEDLRVIVESRSRVERLIQTHLRRQEVIDLRDRVAEVEATKTTAEIPISTGDLRQFDRIAEEILLKWSFPGGSTAQYSSAERDLIVNSRRRRSYGKGVRSVLHALFNVTLAEYCLRREFRHPGFVILDSPIVSYRQPGEPEPTGEDETVSVNVVDSFYTYMQESFRGQALVLENKSPISPLPQGAKEYFFEGPVSGVDRVGFYPVV